MRKSILLFVVLTLFFFGIFAELLTIRKEAIFDEWAEDYNKGMIERENLFKTDFEKETFEWIRDEIDKKLDYYMYEVAHYATMNNTEMIEYLKNKNHRKIPLIGLLDAYSNIYSTTFIIASSVTSFAGSSGEITKFGEELRSEIQEAGNMDNAKNPEWWREFEKSDEYKEIVEQYFIRINSYKGKSVEELYRETSEIKNPIKNPFSPKRIILDNCIEDYKIYNNKVYLQYPNDFESRNLVKATVGSRTIYGLSLESKYLKGGQIDPIGADLPNIYVLVFSDIFILLLTSIIISFLIVRFYERKISPILIGAIVGGVLSALLYRNILFFIWLPIGGAISVYKSEIVRKRDLLIIGVKVGFLAFFINFAVILIMYFFGLHPKETSMTESGTMLFIAYLFIPILFILFSICGCGIGFMVRKLHQK